MTLSRLLCRIFVLAGGALLCALAASCEVGPNYRRPELGLDASYKSATTQEAAGIPRLGRDWWRLFGDPVLDDLERQALAANTDIQAAVARVAQARQATRSTASQFYPVVTFDPSINRSRSPSNGVFISGNGTTVTPVTPGPTTGPSTGGGGRSSGGGGVAGRTTTSVRIPFDLSYEIDIWGRVRRSVEAADAQQRASEADFEVVLQTLEADVAQNYFTLRSLDAQIDILHRTVDSYWRQVELTETQLRAGIVGPTDAYQARAQLSATETQEIDNRRQRADVEHALAVLLGRPPAGLSIAPMPLDLPTPVLPAAGLPADLLRRRPDVAEAEYALAAASAQVGVSEAEFYPTVRLTGAAGFQSLDLQHALDWEQRVWSIGPSVTFPIFEGGRLEANLAQSKARFDELLANYRGSVFQAIRDVEDSLTDLHHRADMAAAQERAVAASREYVRLSTIQYKQGLVNSLVVIDAERTLLSNELSAAQILNQRLVSTVLLIKSLGGGWDVSLPPASFPPAGPPMTRPASAPSTTQPATEPATRPAATEPLPPATQPAATQPAVAAAGSPRRPSTGNAGKARNVT
jgi:multidrug efflux system outer membrane protein